ncbi:hypothetical protein V8E36_007957 [Tilletia maclaganii]
MPERTSPTSATIHARSCPEQLGSHASTSSSPSSHAQPRQLRCIFLVLATPASTIYSLNTAATSATQRQLIARSTSANRTASAPTTTASSLSTSSSPFPSLPVPITFSGAASTSNTTSPPRAAPLFGGRDGSRRRTRHPHRLQPQYRTLGTDDGDAILQHHTTQLATSTADTPSPPISAAPRISALCEPGAHSSGKTDEGGYANLLDLGTARANSFRPPLSHPPTIQTPPAPITTPVTATTTTHSSSAPSSGYKHAMRRADFALRHDRQTRLAWHHTMETGLVTVVFRLDFAPLCSKFGNIAGSQERPSGLIMHTLAHPFGKEVKRMYCSSIRIEEAHVPDETSACPIGPDFIGFVASQYINETRRGHDLLTTPRITHVHHCIRLRHIIFTSIRRPTLSSSISLADGPRDTGFDAWRTIARFGRSPVPCVPATPARTASCPPLMMAVLRPTAASSPSTGVVLQHAPLHPHRYQQLQLPSRPYPPAAPPTSACNRPSPPPSNMMRACMMPRRTDFDPARDANPLLPTSRAAVHDDSGQSSFVRGGMAASSSHAADTFRPAPQDETYKHFPWHLLTVSGRPLLHSTTACTRAALRPSPQCSPAKAPIQSANDEPQGPTFWRTVWRELETEKRALQDAPYNRPLACAILCTFARLCPVSPSTGSPPSRNGPSAASPICSRLPPRSLHPPVAG